MGGKEIGQNVSDMQPVRIRGVIEQGEIVVVDAGTSD